MRVLFSGWVALGLLGIARDSLAAPRGPARAAASLEIGETAFAQGRFEEAIVHWREAATLAEKARDTRGHAHALLRQAAACRGLGQHRVAKHLLESVIAMKDRSTLAEAKAALGTLLMFTRFAEQSDGLLTDALKLARAEKNGALAAAVLNDLGVLRGAQGRSVEALAAYEETARLARSEGDPALLARARKNMAGEALAAKDWAGAESAAREAAATAATLPASHDQAFLLMGAAKILQQLFIEGPGHDNALRAEASKLHRQAQQTASTTGDDRALAWALGYQAEGYEFEKRFPEAIALSRAAVAAAQRARSPDALYRWQWQSGRILAAQGERAPAIQAYRRAVETLGTIRNDVSIRHGNRNVQSSFRDAAGALYFELADLLLQSADALEDPAEIQSLLRDARDTAELLKAAELEDYFQDDCVNLLRSKIRKVEVISPTAAILYIVPLPGRTEVLASLPSGRIIRHKVAISDEQLTATVRQFRLNLENRTTDGYLEQAQLLYTWLIRPLESMLAAGKLDTLVFVPDGSLRTVPMAALHDGKRFLIEKFAVAVTPGLELMEARPVGTTPPRMMINGLSEGVGGFAPLVHVPEELAKLESLYGKQDVMMNKTFRRDAVGEKLKSEDYTIVHIASHGHMDRDVRKSFVLTFDSRMTLDDLETYIRPAQLRDNPLELLTLSACQTAAGDDRAALGLAGIAVKAGARSAFATLWFVNDRASTQLVGDFYTELKTRPARGKAQALQVAQCRLLQDARTRHPCYWAPYLIIGNWL